MEPWLRDWSFYVIDAIGQFGGLLTSWNLGCRATFYSSSDPSIDVALDIKNSCNLNSININGSYVDRISFWEILVEVGISSNSNTVVGVNIKFSTLLRE